MSQLGFAANAGALVRGCRTLFVVAPAATFDRFPPALDKPLRELAAELAAGVSPGDNGSTAETLTGQTRPRQLVVGVLPDVVSRYNSPARAEAIRSVVASRSPKASDKTGILLVLDEATHLVAGANAVARALPLFNRKQNAKAPSVRLLAVDRQGRPLRVSADIRATIEGTRQAARLVDTPPSDLDPAHLAREARVLLRGLRGVKVREIVGPELVKNKLGGIHAVGRCALQKPRMLVATYVPAGRSRTSKHVALVGKGITYDTGGLNIKTGSFMSGMKGDMGGAAAVLGAFRALAATGCRHKLSLVLCIAENAIGPASYKPDDILEMHSGKTVEINNTDAEGRLLLADGVSYAARKLGANPVFDAATLTGAQSISTGKLHAAVIANDAELEAGVVAAGRSSGDLCHPLPFAPEFYRKEFASQVADMKNSVKNRRNAQTSCAAQFVYSHIEDTQVRWCHVDLAGPARPRERGTGFGVALLAEAVRNL